MSFLRARAQLAAMARAEQRQAAENPYLSPGMPLSRVRADALDGVTLARAAWRVRDPNSAARELGAIVEPTAPTNGGPDRAE